MYQQLPIFALHLLLVAEKTEKRLPMADRLAGQVKRLFEAADQHPGLASFFPPELQRVNCLLKRCVADDGAGMPAADEDLASRLSYLRRDLQELRVFCAYVPQSIPPECRDLAMLLEPEHPAKLALRQTAHLNCSREADLLAREYANAVLQHRQITQALARAQLNKQMLVYEALKKASLEISNSFDDYQAAIGHQKRRSTGA